MAEPETQNRVGRQRAAIEKIRSDNEALKSRLARESRFSRMSQNMSTSSDIVRLQEEANKYLHKIEVERKKIAELDQTIAEHEQEIVSQRRKMGGVNASKDNHTMISRQIKLYENRLDKALVKFNESLAKNKALRDRIDDLRRERVVFDVIYKKLERELHEKKKEMKVIIEDSKNAYAQRDKAQSEMFGLKAQAEKERRDFETEWKNLGVLMERDRQVREAMRKRQTQRAAAALANQTGAGGDASTAQAEQHRRETWGGGNKPESQAPLSLEKVNSFEESFEKIKASTGINTIDELVEKFLQAEDKNFRLFNFVNHTNSEIERLEVVIADTKAEIEKHKGQGVSTDTQRKKILRDLEERLARTERKADEYDKKYMNAMKTINQLKTGIHSIFTRLGCNSSSVEEMLGNQGVTESNMMQYLGIIEQRTSAVLQQYAASQAAGSADTEPSIGVIKDGVLQPPAPRLTVMPPAWEEFSSGEESEQEDDERPLTREELTRKTLRGIGRQHGVSAKNRSKAAAGKASR